MVSSKVQESQDPSVRFQQPGDQNDGSTSSVDVNVGKPSKRRDDVTWTVDEVPPWHLCTLLGLQHYVAMFVGSLSVPFVLTPALCVGEDNVAKSQIIGTLFFVSGVITLLQVLLGVRLPLIQAGSFALLSPTLSYLNLQQNRCPTILPPGSNATDNFTLVAGTPEHRELWQSRLCQIQGSLMVAALLEVLMGFSGAIGLLLRYIGPLSIAPTISLLGVSLFRSAAANASKQWWIAFATFGLVVIFSLYLGRLGIPCPQWNKKNGKRFTKYPLFKMFPVILALGAVWLLCYIFTLTNVFPDDPDLWGYEARTDIRSDVLSESEWFRMPYPGQWGQPTVNVALVCGLLSGLMASMVESVGDYYACARLAGAPPPPVHAINRGIGIEGLGCIIAGAFGTGNGTTSTSINIGVVGITKTGSRAVVLVAAAFMMILAVISKFGALFVTVPDPIIGGSFFVLFGMIVSVGISSLQHVDLNSSRNLFIFGFSFFLGLTLSEWLKDNPEAIKTGSDIGDSVLTVLLSTSMFVGGFVAFLLDNTVPGTLEERGLAAYSGSSSENVSTAAEDNDPQASTPARIKACYDLPCCMTCLNTSRVARYLPFCPTFGKKEVNMEDKEKAPWEDKVPDGPENGSHTPTDCCSSQF